MSDRDIHREEFGDFFGQERRHIDDDERRRYRNRDRDIERWRMVDYYDRERGQFSPVDREGNYGRAGWTGYGSEGDWEGHGGHKGGFERGMSWGQGGDYGRGSDWGPMRRGQYGEYEGRGEHRENVERRGYGGYQRQGEYGGYGGREQNYGYNRGPGYQSRGSEWGPQRFGQGNRGGYQEEGYRGNYGWGGTRQENYPEEGFGWEAQRTGGYGAGAGYGDYGQRSTGRFTGRGPRGYQRSDDRIREDINDRLTDHPEIDPSDVEVHVQNGEVTLRGTVDNRYDKRLAEDIAESVPGIKEINNEIRVQRRIGEQRAA